MTRKDCDLYIQLAQLVRANVSGPVKREMISKAQNRLINNLRKRGALDADEADALLL